MRVTTILRQGRNWNEVEIIQEIKSSANGNRYRCFIGMKEVMAISRYSIPKKKKLLLFIRAIEFQNEVPAFTDDLNDIK